MHDKAEITKAKLVSIIRLIRLVRLLKTPRWLRKE